MLTAYVLSNKLGAVTADDARLLDRINIAFAKLEDGLVSLERETLREIIRIKSENPGIKIVASAGGLGVGGFSALSGTAAGRKKFAESCRRLVRDFSLDGVDIDWEYPTSSVGGIDSHPNDGENFVLLLEKLREMLPRPMLLTVAAVCDEDYLRAVDVKRISPMLDCLALMTYDLRGVGETAGHHAALYRSEIIDDCKSAEYYVNLFARAGVPMEKIAIGAAFYSRIWRSVPDGGRCGLGMAGSAGSGGYGPMYGELAREYIGKCGYELHRDGVAPYLYNAQNGDFISFDDTVSVREKAEYVRSMGLAGMIYWEHSCDPSGELLRAMRDGDFEKTT